MSKFLRENSDEWAEDVKKICRNPDTKTLLVSYINSIKAGSPTDERIFWVCQRPKEIARKFAQVYQRTVSHGTVKGLLLELGYRFRKQAKDLPTGSCANRNLQFHIITTLVLSMSLQSPIISIDCKKKERLGNLYREGKCYTQAPLKVYDHDYEHLSEGKVIPHGIYDLQANEGYISLGNSSETADFITDNLLWWWTQYGIHRYPDAQTILVFCDAGGGNSYRHHLFKDRLLALSADIGLSVVVAHYPPYASKWNPIEHRLFCHVHRAMSGVVFTDYATIKERIESTTSSTGLRVVVRLNLGVYQKGIKIDKAISQHQRIGYHPVLPTLNYRIRPD